MKPPVLPVLILLLIGLGGCAGEKRMLLPELRPDPDQSIPEACARVFPRGHWQFIHAIEFALRGKAGGSTVLGVTDIDGRQLSCALTTVEGLTLFSAQAGPDRKLEVRRALAPFDKPAFAERLMRDVRMIFLPPPAGNVHYGRLADGTPVCRHSGADGSRTDILPEAEGCWRINSFAPEARLDRTLSGYSCTSRDGVLIPDSFELKAFGRQGYALKMTLINADNLNRKTSQ